MEQIPEYINLLSYLFIVVYMLSVPLETSSGEILQTLGNLNLMGRALLANFVIIPILGILIARFFDLPADIRTGFLLLAMAPGGLLALQFARVSKGNRVLAVALLFVFCLLAILITPALVLLFFRREGAGHLPFGWLILTAVASHCSAGVCWAGVANAHPPTRAQARLVVGKAIHRDLCDRCGDGRQIQVAGN